MDLKSELHKDFISTPSNCRLPIWDDIKIIKNNKGDILLKKVSTIVGYKTYSSFYREYNKYKDLWFSIKILG